VKLTRTNEMGKDIVVAKSIDHRIGESTRENVCVCSLVCDQRSFSVLFLPFTYKLQHHVESM